ncbi:arginine N-succinyltransferase [Paucibacter sediminis]|uniref:Arginine N-succinyltransferase n=1 Tax=Paucibacter sediminis TaxID=3019553 RepID=A0AA95NNP6_9BURK|nr:arginine N-succinyltransferase [Paucibacter sp. S2-9]WIT13346.1 arginine N-succinyltransferase [Paucibacter sp. S2-9]
MKSSNLHVRAVSVEDLAPGKGGLRSLLPGGTDTTLPAPESGEQWLLVERLGVDGGRPLACLRLRAGIGLQAPRHWYHVGCVVHAAKPLQLFHRQSTLLLGSDHAGASELADLCWARAGLSLAEQAAALRLLLRAALLQLAQQRHAHGVSLIIELPGPRDDEGRSPFWQGLGRHFYAGEMMGHTAGLAARHGPDWRALVAVLLPRQPVYASFLPAATQAAIGQVDASAQLLPELLGSEGLAYDHHVGIIDGGPVFAACIDRLPALLQARRLSLAEGGDAATSEPWLLALPGQQTLLLRGRREGQVLRLAQALPADLRLAGDALVWALPLELNADPR